MLIALAPRVFIYDRRAGTSDPMQSADLTWTLTNSWQVLEVDTSYSRNFAGMKPD
jgi:hypothetical protein